MNNQKEFNKSYALLLLVKILKSEGLEKNILVKMLVDELDKIKNA